MAPSVVHASDVAGPIADEVRQLSTLLEASQALLKEPSLKTGLVQVLEILGRHHGAVRSTVALIDEETGNVEIEASAGAVDRGRRVRYRIGEGITGRVLESGRPIVVPQMSREPSFLFRAAKRPELASQELSYVSVPIRLDGKTVGVLGIDLVFAPGRDYERTAQFVGVVGAMIAHSLKTHRLVLADRQRLIDENQHLRQELKGRYTFSNIVGTSSPMRHVYAQVAQVARANTTVLLRGESGTGKELIAHALHHNSRRAKKAFIRVNCAALPQELIESELFGYEKGAFTGANGQKKGRFELAQGGTLFLDEVGELNAATQVKLLRVLQEREFERLGGTETIRTDLRLIAATNKDIEKAIADGSFREDLYYRLNVFAIFIPPLRERKPDILLLADHFLEKFSASIGKVIKRISTPAIDMLMAYHWPGNVRELENAIEHAVVVCDSQAVHAHHLPPTLQTAESSDTMINRPLADMIASFEKDAIMDTLKCTRGSRTKAARLLGMTQRIFNYRVKKYAIDWKRFR
jgi:Nif-specific regulatory protein